MNFWTWVLMAVMLIGVAIALYIAHRIGKIDRKIKEEKKRLMAVRKHNILNN